MGWDDEHPLLKSASALVLILLITDGSAAYTCLPWPHLCLMSWREPGCLEGGYGLATEKTGCLFASAWQVGP